MPPPKKNPIGVTKRKLFQYSPRKVSLALDAIRDGMPVATASRKYDVPRTTLRHKVSGAAPETSGHVGPQPVLGYDIENELVVWIKDCARAGFPINKEGLLDSVKKIVEKGNIQTPFNNNRPSRSWFDGFMTRHADLSQKQSEYINKARAMITENKIRKWFEEVSNLLAENVKILEDPSRVWNCDETAFFLAPKGALVLAEKGQHVYDCSKNSDKENITTLFTVNAAGEFAPPSTVYKYKRMNKEIVHNAPKGWGVGKTDKGWMTGESFYEYIGNVFIPYLNEKRIQLPIILFLDGHKSHLTMHLTELCRENGIIVIALVPNTTHMLQPLDVAVFFPLKQKWREFVKRWRIDHDGQEITKYDLPLALQSLLFTNGDAFSNNVKAGFKTCGLYPFGADFVNYKRIITYRDDSAKEANRNQKDLRISESSYISYLESKIDPKLLKEFYITFESGKDWEGSKEGTLLYDTWVAFKNDINATASPAFISSCCSGNPNRETNSPSLLDKSWDAVFVDVDDGDDSKDKQKANEINAIEEVRNTSTTNYVTSYQGSLNPTSNEQELPSNLENCIKKIALDEITSETTSNSRVVTKTASDLVKSCVLYPGKVVPKNHRKAMYVPSVITSDKWREIMKAAEKEKSEKKCNKKKKAVQIKPKKKKVARVISSSEDDDEVNYIESGESEISELNDLASFDLSQKKEERDERLKKGKKQKNSFENIEDSDTSSESNLPLNLIHPKTDKKCYQDLKLGSYVIIKYEGEYFPGRIENKDKDLYEVSTMVLSTNNTFRWPERPDRIWYTIKDIVEMISSPVKHNNRGFFKVTAMEKYLPSIYA